MTHTSSYDIEKIRRKMAAKVDGRRSDPFEFRPPKAKSEEVLKYRFYILPDLVKGDKVNGGLASCDMDTFVVKHGQHWVNNKPHPCPRLFNDEECEMCQAGFDALAEIPKSDKAKRQAVVRQFLSSSVFAGNIYFPPIDPNPEELRGRVCWYNAPKQVFDMWYAALNRNDGGDADDPEAHGVIYNPYGAFLFQLVAKKGGDYNEYKASKFIAAAGAHPIVMVGGKPDEAAIQKILDSRHDLFTKIEVPDPQKIHQLYQNIMHGDDGSDEIKPTTPENMAQAVKTEARKPGKTLPSVPLDDADHGQGVTDKAATDAGVVTDEEDLTATAPTPPATKVAAAKTTVAKKPATESTTDLADEVPATMIKPATKTVAKPAAPAPAKVAPAKAAVKPAVKPAVVEPEADSEADQVAGSDDDDDGDIQAILANLRKGDN